MSAAPPNLEEIVAAAVSEWQRTGQLNVADWCDRYPSVAAQLQPLLRALSTSNTPRPTADRTVAPAPQSGRKLPNFLEPPQGPNEIGRLGPYRILGLLGQGGMGTVLRTEDPVLHRPLALKVMPPELANDAEARQRFLREAQATAALEHDNIIGIHQVGEVAGLPFIAMPVLTGETLEARLRRSPPLDWTEAVRIAREVAAALACAHTAGLIHRDIKPANVFLKAPHAQVKVLDFGLARGTSDEQKLTKSGIMLGTPAYMSPEQARGAGNIDHRTDLFSLGVLLYRMLSGTQPFETNTLTGTLSRLMLFEPPALAEVCPHLPPALAQLTTALLAKELSQRPPSAGWVEHALMQILTPPAPVAEPAPAPKYPRVSSAAEIWLGIEDEAPPPAFAPPVLMAAPVAPPRRPIAWGRWLAVLSGLVAVLAVLVGALLVLKPQGTLALRGTTSRVQVLRDDAPITEVAAPGDVSLPPGEYTLQLAESDTGLDLSTSSITVRGGQRVEVQILAPPPKPKPTVPAPPKPDPPTAGPFAGLSVPASERTPDLPTTVIGVLGASNLRHEGPVIALAYTANGTRITSLSLDDRCLVSDSATGVRVAYGPACGGTTCAAISSNGGQFAASGGRPGVMLGSTATGAHNLALTTNPPGTVAVAYHPDNRRLAVVLPKLVYVIDGVRNSVLLNLHAPGPALLTSAAWHPQKDVLAVGTQDGQVYQWELAKPDAPLVCKAGPSAVTALAYHPQEGRLAVAQVNGQLEWWDVGLQQATAWLPAGPALTCVAFNASGTHWAVAGLGPNVRLGSVASQQVERVLIGTAPAIRCVAFSPDGTRVAAGGDDQLIRQWEFATGRALTVPSGHLAAVQCVAVRADSQLIVSGDRTGTVIFWDGKTGQAERTLAAHTVAVGALAFSVDQAFVATAGIDGSLALWDRYTPAPRWRIPPRATPIRRLVAVGKVLLVGGDGPTRVVDVDTGVERGQLPAAPAWAVVPGSTTVIHGDGAGKLYELDALTGQPIGGFAPPPPGPTAPTEAPVPVGGVQAIAVHPQGQQVAALTAEGVVRVWDRATRQIVGVYPLPPQTHAALAFTPTGTLRLWAPQALRTWKLGTELPIYAQAQITPISTQACFTVSAGQLVSAQTNGTLLVHRWLGE
jgi:serine/threonine protein kinase/WD40 repeat protein